MYTRSFGIMLLLELRKKRKNHFFALQIIIYERNAVNAKVLCPFPLHVISGKSIKIEIGIIVIAITNNERIAFFGGAILHATFGSILVELARHKDKSFD